MIIDLFCFNSYFLYTQRHLPIGLNSDFFLLIILNSDFFNIDANTCKCYLWIFKYFKNSDF